jgi:alanine racemase
MPHRPLCEARIDAAAIRANAAVLRSRRTVGRLVADVTGDGYGHGLELAAAAVIAGGADVLGIRRVGDITRAAQFGAVENLEYLYHGDEIVIGAELYGLTPDPELVPAMRVSARVLGLKTIEAGEGVSYGYTYRSTARTNLALIGIGYTDGLDRSASNTGSVLLGGELRRIAGRVAMNVLMVDLGDDTVALDDEAVIFGDPANGEPSATDWAAVLGKTAAEVASSFGARLEHTSTGGRE